MAIRTFVHDGKKLFEVYVNGFNARGTRVQRKRTNIETLRKAEVIEFELKRELAILRESKVDARWEEWAEECLNIMEVTYRPSTVYSYRTTLEKWVNRHLKGRELKGITKTDVHSLIYELIPSEATMFIRKYVLKIIRRVLQMAVDHSKLDRNPCNGMMVKVPETEKKVLTNQRSKSFSRRPRQQITVFIRSGLWRSSSGIQTWKPRTNMFVRQESSFMARPTNWAMLCPSKREQKSWS